MQTHGGGGSFVSFVRGFVGVWGALILMAPAGALADPTETVLHSFRGGGDGAFSNHGVVSDASGALYGTTEAGGGSSNCPDPVYPGCGAVFKLAPPASGSGPWTETVLYSFKGGSDGRAPNGPLILDSSGALYGTTAEGENSNCPYGCGTVFKLTPLPGGGTPWIETTLYSFKGGSDGNLPFGSLIFDSSGALAMAPAAARSTSWRRQPVEERNGPRPCSIASWAGPTVLPPSKP